MNEKRKNQSLGLIETWGITGAIEAADAGCKAANVELVGYELNKAGFATTKFTGDVSSVHTAVLAGVAAAGKVAQVISSHVIARPDRQLASVTVDSPDNVPSSPAPAPVADSSGDVKTESAAPAKSSAKRKSRKPVKDAAKAEKPGQVDKK